MDAHRNRYGVLPGVSTGCPPDEGWLHTRYAPVRHSHSPEGEIPYDLHVLGLPLAFILSQDQTLHCIIVVLFLFPVLGLRYDSLFLTGGPRLLGGPARLLASYAGLKLSKNCSTFPSYCPSSVWSKTAAKVQPFFILASLFSLFFQKFFSPLIISLLETQKNSHTLYKVWLFGIVSVL